MRRELSKTPGAKAEECGNCTNFTRQKCFFFVFFFGFERSRVTYFLQVVGFRHDFFVSCAKRNRNSKLEEYKKFFASDEVRRSMKRYHVIVASRKP